MPELSLVFADSPSGGGAAEPSDASERRSFLLHKARTKKTRGPAASVADTSRLLEDVASEANLAKALLNVVRNKGAPGVDGQTVEAAEARAPSSHRLALLDAGHISAAASSVLFDSGCNESCRPDIDIGEHIL